MTNANTRENSLSPAFLKRPDAERRIVACGCETVVVRAEAETADGLAMALPRSQVVHVGLKVLDDAALVCGRQICARVRELHRANRIVVRLQDGLEVERQPVPERELAARGSRQNPPPFWRPLSKECKPSIHASIDVSRELRRTTTTLTGHLILLVDVCTNLVHSEVEALSGYALGGRSCNTAHSVDVLSCRIALEEYTVHRLYKVDSASNMGHISGSVGSCATGRDMLAMSAMEKYRHMNSVLTRFQRPMPPA